MVANVEIISKEMIKPSSPTPHHLRDLKLSFLDQIAPPIYTPLLFFYQCSQILPSYNKDGAQISQLLKQSLSVILTQFYPLAGRLSSESFTIDCNDSGALYVEAKIHANLSEVIEDPSMDDMKQYLPLGPNGRDCSMAEVNTILLALQINIFDCGGIAVGVQMSHKIADGTSLVNFMNAWAATCRGDDENFQPGFDLASIFPPKDLSSFGFKPSTGMTKEKIITKHFVFDKEKLAKLKQAESSVPGSQVKDPTRVEAVSAFFWRHFMEVAKAKNANQMVAAVHAVNLRPRTNPALPNQTFGNAWRHTLAIPNDEGEKGCHNLVDDLRSEIRKINGNYVKKIQSGDEYFNSLKKIVALKLKGETELCNFSSWCRFPLYQVDYGWGKPTWVCTTTFPFKNVVILMSTSCGEGIEAWVNILEESDLNNIMNHHSISIVAERFQ